MTLQMPSSPVLVGELISCRMLLPDRLLDLPISRLAPGCPVFGHHKDRDEVDHSQSQELSLFTVILLNTEYG